MKLIFDLQGLIYHHHVKGKVDVQANKREEHLLLMYPLKTWRNTVFMQMFPGN